MKTFLAATCAALLLSTQAHAQFNLQITEIFPGNEPGENLTPDWFEVTNIGDTAYDVNTDGFLFFDDDSQDATTADLITGVTTIAPGESVVFIDGPTTTFETLWSSEITLPQLGSYDGSGLSQGGDGATLFLGPELPSSATFDTDALTILDFEGYPDANPRGGQSYDVELQLFSGVLTNEVITAGVNDVGQPAVGTPGFLGTVPEPTTAALIALGACGVLAFRRR